jgi:hypothetical protein
MLLLTILVVLKEQQESLLTTRWPISFPLLQFSAPIPKDSLQFYPSHHHLNQPKKSKKLKPKLTYMSIGDMILAPKKLGVGKDAKNLVQLQLPQKCRMLEVNSSK